MEAEVYSLQTRNRGHRKASMPRSPTGSCSHNDNTTKYYCIHTVLELNLQFFFNSLLSYPKYLMLMLLQIMFLKLHFPTIYFQYESESEVTQSCLILCDPVDCSPPGSSVYGILQARILEWVAISFSRASSLPRDRTQVSHIAGRRFNL